MKYINLDGSEFEGPVFHPQMEVVGLPDGKVYRTIFNEDRSVKHRVQLAVDGKGYYIWEDPK